MLFSFAWLHGLFEMSACQLLNIVLLMTGCFLWSAQAPPCAWKLCWLLTVLLNKHCLTLAQPALDPVQNCNGSDIESIIHSISTWEGFWLVGFLLLFISWLFKRSNIFFYAVAVINITFYINIYLPLFTFLLLALMFLLIMMYIPTVYICKAHWIVSGNEMHITKVPLHCFSQTLYTLRLILAMILFDSMNPMRVPNSNQIGSP